MMFKRSLPALHILSTTVTFAWLVSAACHAAGQPQHERDAWGTSDPVVQATNRGVALMEQYAYTEAVKAFKEALKLAPGSVEIRVNLAIAIYNRSAKGDLEKGEELLDSVLSEEPGSARALYFRAITHQYRGRDEQAVPLFERVVAIRPHDAAAWYLLARSKSHLGRPCRTELERAVKENPALASAYYDLMRVARQEGKRDEAERFKERFLALRGSPLAELVVMPHYNQMGPLATVQPLSATPRRGVASGELSAGPVKTLWEATHSARPPGSEPGAAIRAIRGRAGRMALADVNGDGRLDVVAAAIPGDGDHRVILLLGQPEHSFRDASEPSGLVGVRNARSFSFGDYDNDDNVDLFISCLGPNHLFRGRGDGTFEDVTAATGTGGSDVHTASAVFLDADHDGDLDIYVCNLSTRGAGRDSAPAANQLLNNNADGTFTDIAAGAGVACRSERSVMLAPADIDGDRDTDLIVFNIDAPARVFMNDRMGKYHEERITDKPVRGDSGGVLQDFNGDGRVDLLVFPGRESSGRLYLTDATGKLQPSAQFEGCTEAICTWGAVDAVRVADVDLDGDLDVGIFASEGHVLLNDGLGQFVVKANLWPVSTNENLIGTVLLDFTGDGVPDCVQGFGGPTARIEFLETKLTPSANWVAVSPTGLRGADKRTRSPASGFGTHMELRCGLHSQIVTYTGLSGGLGQSQTPLVFGLNGATQADYLALRWPDGVTQCESGLAAKTHHRISETERRVSSCPVLFAWNGERFEFVTDFAGVGGLGYFVAPGEYTKPQVLEHVKIEPRQLAAKDGFYELRVTEPMEEVAYIDRLELVAVDHPRGTEVYPDERLAVTGPSPTHRLLHIAEPIYPVRTMAPDGSECTKELEQVDRVHAYEPKLDRRFYGFCEPHTLTLDFADRLRSLEPNRGVWLFITGSIEYPYSQTTYAAGQAGVRWKPLRIERENDSGGWETVISDAGAPGGMGRTMAVDLTGKLAPGTRRLRISTNLEIYYDRLFIGIDRGLDGLAIRSVPLADATLRRLGFPLEYTPDGQHPTIYNYDVIEPTSSFKIPKGRYTRYGPVEGLLTEFDDRYVILGTGDEIATRFDARKLPPPVAGYIRSFILISHAYCKDMDLYTAEPDTVEPLPFADMSAYPYPAGERIREGTAQLRWHRQFNTRVAE